MALSPPERPAYDRSGARRRHVTVIRHYLHVKPDHQDAPAVLDRSIRDAAQIKEDLVDLINVGIEERIRQRIELPGFTTLRRAAQHGRATGNHGIYHHVAAALGAEGRTPWDHLHTVDQTTGHTLWTTIKADPGEPTLTPLRQLVARLKWLTSYNGGSVCLGGRPLGERAALRRRSPQP